MTHPEPVDFDAEVAGHLARLNADRAVNQPVNEPVKQPVTPAEERTGVSDVQHAVLGEVAELRLMLQEVDTRLLSAESAAIFGALDRIEQWTRGQS